MNEFIRDDIEETLRPCIPICRAINTLLVNRGPAAAVVPKPPLGYTMRGCHIPVEALKFFEAGLDYRVPMFLATSFDPTVAHSFATRDMKPNHVPVLFKVALDPTLGCNHVNFITKTAVQGEEEYLFPPYSAFRVVSPPRLEGLTWHVDIMAYPDNKMVSEDVPLSNWH